MAMVLWMVTDLLQEGFPDFLQHGTSHAGWSRVEDYGFGFLLVLHQSQKVVVVDSCSPCTCQGCAQVPGLPMLPWPMQT